MCRNSLARNVRTSVALLVTVSGFARSLHGESPIMPIKWDWGPVMSRAQSAFGTSATPAGIAVVGGTFWSTEGAREPAKHWLSTVNVLDLSHGRWQAWPAYPTAIGDQLVACVGDEIYSVGGRNEHGAVQDVFVLNARLPQAGWRAGPPLPAPLSRLRGGVSGRIVYALSDEPTPHSTGGNPFRGKLLALDTAAAGRQWRTVAALPHPSCGYRSATVCEGRVYLFGGGTPQPDQSIQLISDAWTYEPRQANWRKLRPLPTPVRDASTAVVDGRYVFLAGGVEQAVGPAVAPDAQERIILSNRCWLYDTKLDTYAPLTSLRLAVADHGLAAIGRTIFAIGGEDSPYRTRTDLVQIGRLSGGSGGPLREQGPRGK
jgi:hypothetical protein